MEGVVDMKKVLGAVSVFLFIGLVSCQEDSSTGPESPRPKEGEATIVAEKIVATNAVIYTNGDRHTETADLKKGQLAVVVLKDSAYLVYNDGLENTFKLSKENSKKAILELMLRYYENVFPLQKGRKDGNPSYQLQTGVEIQQISESTYQFVNQKARWAGVQVDNQQPFLMEARDVLPEISVAAAIGSVVDATMIRTPQLEVRYVVRTFGSPFRAFFLAQPQQFGALSNSKMAQSLKQGLQVNRQFMIKLICADAISVCADAARQIIASLVHASDLVGAPLAACNELVTNGFVWPVETAAWAMISSTSQSEFDAARTQVLKSSARFIGSQVECLGQVVCSGATSGLCQVIYEIVQILNDGWNDIALIANTVAGIYDATNSLAYDELLLSYPMVQGPCEEVPAMFPLGTVLAGKEAIGYEGDFSCYSDVYTDHGVRISPWGGEGRAYYDFGPAAQGSVSVTFEWVDNAWFSDIKALEVYNWTAKSWERIASWNGNDGKVHTSTYSINVDSARKGPLGQIRIALYGGPSSVIHLNTITVR